MHKATLLTAFVLVIVTAVTAFALRYRIQGPVIVIQPVPSVTNEPEIVFELETSNTQELTINDVPVTPNLDGSVRISRYLQPGSNSFTFIGEDRYNKVTEQTLWVHYQQQ